MPGNVAYTIAGHFASPEQVAAIEARLGLNDPLWTQFWRWAGAALHGDMGQSLVMGRPVGPLISGAGPLRAARGGGPGADGRAGHFPGRGGGGAPWPLAGPADPGVLVAVDFAAAVPDRHRAGAAGGRHAGMAARHGVCGAVRRLRRLAVAPGDAGLHAGTGPGGPRDQPAALQHARDPERALCARGPRQGPARTHGAVPPCLAQRADSHRDGAGAGLRHPDGRHRGGGDGVLVSRPGPPAHLRRGAEGPARAAGRRARGHRHLCPGQPGGGYRLRHSRPRIRYGNLDTH